MGNMSKKYLHISVYMATVMTIAASLHACGFQLRGSIDISENISPIYIEQNSVFDLAREIKLLLAMNKIEVVEDAKQSKVQLTLLNEEKSRRVLSVDGSGRAREYLLIYKVNFVIQTKQSETSAIENIEAANIETENIAAKNNQDSVSIRRNLLFDPVAVLAVTNEAEILYRDMRRDAARLILLKMQARSKSSVTRNNAAAPQAESTNNQ